MGDRGDGVKVLLLIFNYLLFISIIIFMFRNLYENFYARKARFLAVILIVCIFGLLVSFAGTKMCNDIMILKEKAKYEVKDVIIADIVAIITIGFAALIIRNNKKKEEMRRQKYMNENPKDCDRLFSALKGENKNTPRS